MAIVNFGRPSIGEHSGLFNVTDADAELVGMGSSTIIQTVTSLQPLTEDEALAFSLAMKLRLESLGIRVASNREP